MSGSSLNKEDGIYSEEQNEPDDPDYVVSNVMPLHPVWDKFPVPMLM